MTRLDARKRAEWQKRLDEFEASGLTVAHFCRRTNVGPHTFYYWKKRLHPTSTQGRRRAAQHRGGTGSDEVTFKLQDFFVRFLEGNGGQLAGSFAELFVFAAAGGAAATSTGTCHIRAGSLVSIGGRLNGSGVSSGS